MPPDAGLPEALAGIAANKRVLVRRGGDPKADGKCIVYWLQRAQRALDNPALEVAIACANALGLPVVAYFSVIPNYPNANYRHYHFMQQGLLDVAEGLAEREVGFGSAAAYWMATRSKAFSRKWARRCWWVTRMCAANRSAGGKSAGEETEDSFSYC